MDDDEDGKVMRPSRRKETVAERRRRELWRLAVFVTRQLENCWRQETEWRRSLVKTAEQLRAAVQPLLRRHRMPAADWDRQRRQIAAAIDAIYLFRDRARKVMQLAAPTLREIWEDLQSLDEQYELSWNLRRKHLVLTTDPITLADDNESYDVGRFEIRLRLRNLPEREYSVAAIDQSSNEGTPHPHVQDGNLCEGEGAEILRSACQSGRLYDFFQAVDNTLHTYVPGQAYEGWRGNGDRCDDCGGRAGDSYRCRECGDTLCEDCSQSCGYCGASFCNEHDATDTCEHCDSGFCDHCAKQCGCCEKSTCPSCIRRCSDCQKRFCADCEGEDDDRICRDCGEARRKKAEEAEEAAEAEAARAEEEAAARAASESAVPAASVVLPGPTWCGYAASADSNADGPVSPGPYLPS